MARFVLINNTISDLPLKDSRRVPAQKTLAVDQITLEMRRLEKAGRISIKDLTTAASTAKDTNLTPLFVDVLPLASAVVSTVAGAAAAGGITANPQTPAAGASTNVYVKSAAEAVWDITHNLGKFPSVVVIDSAGDEVEGDIQYVNPNRIIITFSAALAGRAFLN